MRTVNGDGSGDRRLALTRPRVAPAWRPDGANVVAYADPAGRVNVVAVDARQLLWRTRPLSGPARLAWSPGGRRLVALTARRLFLFGPSGKMVMTRGLPTGATAREVAWAPRHDEIALVRRDATAGRSEVVLLDASRGLREQVLFSGPGRFGVPAWGPDGRRLLVPWPEANQWLFLRPRGGGRLSAVADIAAQFSPGARRPAFPHAVQWCCAAPRAGG